MTTSLRPTRPRGWSPVAVRPLHVPEAAALGWDIPMGYAADPTELTGRAALAARYFARELAAPTGGTAGWLRKHVLREDESCFSFWAPGANPAALDRAVREMDLHPSPDRLRELAEVQLHQTRSQQASPHAVMFRAIEEAAWGRTGNSAGGDEQTLDAVLALDLPGYLEQCRAAARILDPADPPPARQLVPPPTWRGDLVSVHRPGLQCRIAVQYVLAPELSDPASLAVLTQHLDGPDGLVQRRLRAETGLVYGGVALPRTDGGTYSLVLAVSMLVDRLAPALVQLRELVDEIDTAPLEESARDEAALRARHAMFGEVDGPYGPLEDCRRLRAGQPLLREVVAELPAAARRVQDGPRFARGVRPAVCFVGVLDEDTRTRLEAALWG
jgi:hypothetical protein